MIARVAVVPQPPLLVPELVAGPDPDAQSVRSACLAAAERLADAADTWVAVAADGIAAPTVVGPAASGSFRGYGVDVPVRLSADGSPDADPAMPLPALIAGWLRERAGADRVTVRLVPAGLPVSDCLDFGSRLVSELPADEPVGLLVVGDGSHRHGERAVGRPDERAAGFDEAGAPALADAGPAGPPRPGPRVAAALGAVRGGPGELTSRA